ncbi:MAG: hypothetical protein R3C02_02925 [Planctomycetaceae bacterium]
MRISWGKQRWSMTAAVIRAVTVGAALIMCIGCLHWGPDTAKYGCDTCQTGDCYSKDCESCFCLPKHRYWRPFDEAYARHEASKRAWRSILEHYPERPNEDFQYGYGQAFVDVALGGDGTVPPVPPECYWSTCYRTAAGHQRAQDWFAGYIAGAGHATAHCRYQFNRVAASGQTAFKIDDPSMNGIIPAGDMQQAAWGSEDETSW